jgi:hypothetical protein
MPELSNPVVRSQRRALAFMGLLACGLVWLHSHAWQPDLSRLLPSWPRVVSGDEPHYLLLVHSLLYDRDVDIGDEYEHVRQGGLAAGAKFRGSYLDPHAYLVHDESGRSVKWHAVYDLGRPLPEGTTDAHGVPFEKRQDHPFEPGSYRLAPAHPPAFSMIIATLLAPFGPGPEILETAAGGMLLLLAVVSLFVAYGTGLAAGLTPRGSAVSVALFGACSPWLVFAGSFFSEVTTSLILIGALWCNLRGRTAASAILVMVAVAIKPPYALVGAAWLVQCLAERRHRAALIMAVVFAAGGTALVFLNWWLARVFAISGASTIPTMGHMVDALRPLFGLRQGLLLFAPWTLFAVIGPMLNRRDEQMRRLVGPLMAPLALFATLVFGLGTTGGACYGCRYWIPFLPWMAILAATALRGGRAPMVTLALLAAIGALWATTGALLYSADTITWNQPPYAAIERMLGR